MINFYTSFVTQKNLDYIVSENYLPIFIIRYISNSTVIGKYSGTAIHFKTLSPSDELYHLKRDRKISIEEFFKDYMIEISENNNFQDVINKVTNMAELCNAKGVVFMGYGEDSEICHRKILSEVLGDILGQKIEELKYVK